MRMVTRLILTTPSSALNIAGVTGDDINGTVNNADHSLISDSTDYTITTASNMIEDVDPKLLPLAYNGGTTQTHMLQTNSPAIDAGNCVGVPNDQRGLPRPVDFPSVTNVSDGCDIGAVENQNTLPTALNDTYNAYLDTALNVSCCQRCLVQ